MYFQFISLIDQDLKETSFCVFSQESVESKDSLQSLGAPVKKEIDPDTKDMKVQGEGDNSSKSDSESGDDDDDYDDDEFPPVHIKLPLQLDLDDIAGVNIYHLSYIKLSLNDKDKYIIF